jgi:hypothetical protein
MRFLKLLALATLPLLATAALVPRHSDYDSLVGNFG